MSRNAARGFTLMEIMVALALSGLVALGVHAVFTTMSDGASRASAASASLDAVANQSRLLRALVADIETSNGAGEFAGDSLVAVFTTWCMTPRGWKERCRLTVAVQQAADSPELALSADNATILTLPVAENAELRYLSTLTAGGQWSALWPSSPVLPRAIGIVSARDTLILRIGERG